MLDRLQARTPRDDRKKPSLVEDAYQALKEAIRDNVFPPGFKGRSRRWRCGLA
jgi:DNA-binding GntR family transcriptional regulator